MIGLIKRHKNLIPLLILAIAAIYTIGNFIFNRYENEGVTHTYSLSIENYLAFLAIVLNLVVYFYVRTQFKKVIIATLLISVAGFLNYLPIKISINFGISLQLFPLLISLFYIFLNFNSLFKQKVNEKELPDFNKILDFKEKYANKAAEELIAIVDDKRFTIEAKLAAKELLKKTKI